MTLSFFRRLDFVLLASVLVLILMGLFTMKSFGAQSDYFFVRQIIWLTIGIAVFLCSSFIDWSFLKTNSIFLLIIYLFLVMILIFLAVSGKVVRGATSWLSVYSVGIEPVEILKPILVLLLAKYFSKRHVEIGRVFHLFISSLYVGIPIILVLIQPDLGSSVVLGAIWLGMALVSGIKFKHLFLLFLLAALLAAIAWNAFLFPYQKARVLAFLNPQADLRGAGYQALQSMIAVGSGGLFGKGLGHGTQSRLEFLPEHTTDFIFAAFAEEWGFVGVIFLLFFFGIVLWRIIRVGVYGESNFEKLYAAGLVIFIVFQAGIHLGMNTGVLPITGLGMPFLSYGGSSIISLFFALGILQSFSIYKKGILIGAEGRYSEGILAS